MNPIFKVLIVEDECIFAMDLKFKLIELGYEVIGIASNHYDAVSKAEKNFPDLVLMDIHLKGVIDGIETAKFLKESYGMPSLFITANSDEVTLKKIMDLNPVGILSKPLEDLEFQKILHEFEASNSVLIDYES